MSSDKPQKHRESRRIQAQAGGGRQGSIRVLSYCAERDEVETARLQAATIQLLWIPRPKEGLTCSQSLGQTFHSTKSQLLKNPKWKSPSTNQNSPAPNLLRWNARAIGPTSFCGLITEYSPRKPPPPPFKGLPDNSGKKFT